MHNDTNDKVSTIDTNVDTINTKIDTIGSSSGLSANIGQYDNRIPDDSFTTAYTEICFKNATAYNDQHSGGGSTSGGNCDPGDVGFVIEANQRSSTYWSDAKSVCLSIGMRLPEVYELQISCSARVLFGLNDFLTDYEWASNTVIQLYSESMVPILADSSCADSNSGIVADSSSGVDFYKYRCVK